MAPETRRDLAKQLSALLTDIDIAIRVRLRESATRTGGQSLEAARRDTGIRGAVAAALRRLTRPAASRPTTRRARGLTRARADRATPTPVPKPGEVEAAGASAPPRLNPGWVRGRFEEFERLLRGDAATTRNLPSGPST